MQASPLSAAQLLMEYMDREQGAIGRGILASEFSHELSVQTDKLSDVNTSPSSSWADSASQKSLPRVPLSATLRTSTRKSSQRSPEQDEKRMKSMKRMMSPSKAARKEQLKDSGEEVYVTNSPLLEKALADLKLPAEAQKACKSAEDEQGRISIRSLANILDKTSGCGSGTGEGRISAQDAQSLLSSTVNSKSDSGINVQDLGLKSDGSYDLGEFRQILERAVQQAESSKSTLKANAQQIAQESELNGAVSKTAPNTTGTNSKQPQNLVSSVVPSFGNNGPSDGKKGTTFAASRTAELLNKAGGEAEQGTARIGAEQGTGLNEISNAQLKTIQEDRALRSAGANIAGDNPQSTTSSAMSSRQSSEIAGMGGVVATEANKGGAMGVTEIAEESMTSELNSRYSDQISKSATDQIKNSLAQDGKNPSSQGSQSFQKEGFAFSQSNGNGAGSQSFDAARQALNTMVSQSPGTSMSQQGGDSSAQARLSFLQSSWPLDLAQRFQEMIQQKRMDQLTLELEPKGLGRLTLRIGAKQEEVSAWVSTDKEQVRDLLLKNSPTLRQHLQDQGLTLGQFNVDVRDETADRSSYYQNRQATDRNSNASKFQKDVNDTTSKTTSYVYMERPHQGSISLFA